MICTIRLEYILILIIFCFGCFLNLNQSMATTPSFNYGQCLTEKIAFNQDLKNYNQAALITASIKAFALKKNTNLLKWDYETVKFIYNLALVKTFFKTLVEIYNDPNDLELRSEFESYLTGIKGNDLLQQLQLNGPNDDAESLTSFKDFLKKKDSRKSPKLNRKYQTLLKYMETPLRAHALAELYDVVQSASITIDFLSLKASEQWLSLLDVFLNKSMLKPFIIEAYNKSTVKVRNKQPYLSGILFSEEEYNLNPVWKSELPSLMKEIYPNFSNNEPEAQRLVKYLYSRTLEDFLFSMNSIDYTTVEQWITENNFSTSTPASTPSASVTTNNLALNKNTNGSVIIPKVKPKPIKAVHTKNSKKLAVVKSKEDNSVKQSAVAKSSNSNAEIYYSVLKQAQMDEKSKREATDAKKIFAYLANQERVYSNAFDNFVWHKQDGSPMEKSIDGVARTLYSEAESCQKLESSDQQGIHQFEAMGLAIAHRAINIDKENRLRKKYTNTPNPQENMNPKSEYFSSSPIVGDYYGAARDFGRNGEVMQYPIVSEMPTPAQVVSKPVHFSVWKIAKTELISALKWIPELKSLGYPEDFKIAIASASKSNLDNAQFKALCPTAYPEVFKHALSIASQIVSNPYNYVRKYKLKQQSKKGHYEVIPYFFTHGPKTKLGAKNRSLGNVTLFDAYNENGVPTTLRLTDPKANINCRTFKLYGAHPKHQWSPSLVNKWNNAPFDIY